MKKLTLTIEMGNDGMLTSTQLREAVVKASQKMRPGETSGTIRDLNGNTVGKWEITDDK